MDLSVPSPTETSSTLAVVPELPPSLQDFWAMVKHGLILSLLMAKFIARYSWVIFRLRIVERPLPVDKLVALNKRTAREYVDAAMKLKGGTIKLGQFISARADVMPKEVTEILSELQDRVTPAPYHYVARTLSEQFGRPAEQVFAQLDQTAVAAASFGQVHKATTPAGERVVIKILHRDIERSLRVDLAIMRVTMFFFSRLFPRFAIAQIYDEIAEVTLDELDYAREANSAERVRHNLAGDHRVRVPKVLREFCRPKVLCLEDISGLKVDDPEFIRQHGGDPREVLRAIIGAYCQQIYVDGFFQSDPHPGNLFFYPPDPAHPDQPLIGLIDFGQAKEMPKAVHNGLRRAVMGVLEKNPEEFMEALCDLGVIEHAELGKVRAVVDNLARQIQKGTMTEVMSLDYESLAKDVIQALRELDALTLPNDLILYGRTLGLLQGLNFKLDKELPVFEVAAPYLMKFAFG